MAGPGAGPLIGTGRFPALNARLRGRRASGRTHGIESSAETALVDALRSVMIQRYQLRLGICIIFQRKVLVFAGRFVYSSGHNHLNLASLNRLMSPRPDLKLRHCVCCYRWQRLARRRLVEDVRIWDRERQGLAWCWISASPFRTIFSRCAAPIAWSLT